VQVGMEAVSFPTVGKYSLCNLTNDKGSPLIQFAVSQNMIIGSTFYPCKHFRKSTWMSPDDVTLNPIIVVCFLLSNSPASEFYMVMFRNTLSHLHRRIGMKVS
jgi:hypothetical protein